MNASPSFKSIIEAKLQEIASKDYLFAVSLKKENKTIDGCINYILSTVQKSGINGFEDDEIYNMAIHYYDEDNLEASKPGKCTIVTNLKSTQPTSEAADVKPKAKKVIPASVPSPFIQQSLFE